eukprot:c8807_g1_i1.p1 GENE.c8807_g1_i1~~c8807_g1_i1.p1  ORF type:complete len:227 (+),score=38.24 c8807_g1_i1:50-730(+)
MATKRALVVGGAGALGRSFLARFNSHKYQTISLDVVESPLASRSFITNTSNWHDIPALSTIGPVNTVVCTAGGWVGGGVDDSSIFASCDQMWSSCVQPAVVSCHLASRLMQAPGLVVLTGAQAALHPTPGMIAYGLAKSATHQLVKSVAASSSLPAGSKIVGILPITIDTPTNRKYMPHSDFSKWTPPEEFSDAVLKWMENLSQVPNGALIEFRTVDGVTETITHV